MMKEQDIFVKSFPPKVAITDFLITGAAMDRILKRLCALLMCFLLHWDICAENRL